VVAVTICKSRNYILKEIEDSGVVAVIRANSGDELLDVCRSLVFGGVTACEITMTTPGALAGIEKVSTELGDECLVGVGSVLDVETCRAAILAGAAFVVSPTLDVDVIKMAHRYDRPMIPGALTPTEIQRAWSHGADIVKIFPANHFGPRYFKDLLGPMPQLRLTPTGGVNLDTVTDWIHAGAVCVGVGSALVRKDFIERGDWDQLSALAGEYVRLVAKARSGE